MRLLSYPTLLLAVVALTSSAGARAQPSPMAMHHPMAAPGSTVPTQSGQAAFGAIQEVVAQLQTDPRTNWSKVDIDALRQHLIDMDEVTLRAAIRKEPIEHGLRIEVTGSGRILGAIQRMVPDHARAIDGSNGWSVHAETISLGAVVTVTSAVPGETVKIRALGFAGLLVQGDHHRMHHMAMARGEPIHDHR